jgi:hypothetical protein
MADQQRRTYTFRRKPTPFALHFDVLGEVFRHLDNMTDLNNLSRTCQVIYEASHQVSDQEIFRLCDGSARLGCWSPQPDMLVLRVAEQIGQWAGRSPENAHIFEGYCRRGGIWGLRDLALGPAKCGLSRSRGREFRRWQSLTMVPVTDLIDKCVGEQWYTTPDFWYDGVSDADTISACPTRTLIHLCIYGELFRPALKQCIANKGSSTPLYAQYKMRLICTRLLFSEYWLPEDSQTVIFKYKDGTSEYLCFPNPSGTTTLHSNMDTRDDYEKVPLGHEHDNIAALRHILYATKFNNAFEKLSMDLNAKCGSMPIQSTVYLNENYEPNTEVLWVSCFILSGIEGMKQLATSMNTVGVSTPGSEVDVGWADSMKALCIALDEEPLPRQFVTDYVDAHALIWPPGPNRTSLFWPDLLGDLQILMCCGK